MPKEKEKEKKRKIACQELWWRPCTCLSHTFETLVAYKWLHKIQPHQHPQQPCVSQTREQRVVMTR